MTEHSFSLLPFPARNIPDIKIAGYTARQNNQLTVHYSVSGETEKIRFPPISTNPARKDELWMATCFEFFIAIPNRPEYWEFNMSPAGDWNVYRMDAYRRNGFREEMSIQELPFEIKNESDCVSVGATVDLSPIIQAETAIQAGITSVIQTRDARETYWALAHPHPQADFHLRESFILQL